MTLRPPAAAAVTRVVDKIRDKLDRDLGPMATASRRRPANYNQLSGEDQWEIDKALGILDWDGDPRS